MLRAVLDTNVLLRMAAGGQKSILNQAWQQEQFLLILSLTTLTEFRLVAMRPQLQRYIPTTVTQPFLHLLETAAVFVQPDLSAPTCRDPKDTGLIATAVGGAVDYLVTADADLLDDPTLHQVLGERAIQVVTAPLFLERLGC